MPFPLAHPAAVLPLRRFCPALLSFPALVAGALAPDLGYLFKGTALDDLSHEALGGTLFGISAGSVLVAAWYFFGRLTVRLVSRAGARRGYSPLWEQLLQHAVAAGNKPPPALALVMVVSLLIGVWTHLLLDSITHADGWLVVHSSFLGHPVATVGQRAVKVCHVLWYALSFFGIAWLVLAFRQWQERQGLAKSGRSLLSRMVEASIVSLFVLPIELFHHLVRSRSGLVLVVIFSMVLTAAVIFGLESVRLPEQDGNWA